MKLADIIIIATVVLALPVWLYSVRYQWSQKPGATSRTLKGCLVFAVILVVGMTAAYLAM